MRVRNVASLIFVAFATLGASIFIDTLFFGSWSSHQAAPVKMTGSSVTALVLRQLIPVGVLIVSGASLC
jgi:hypothetical protein